MLKRKLNLIKMTSSKSEIKCKNLLNKQLFSY